MNHDHCDHIFPDEQVHYVVGILEVFHLPHERSILENTPQSPWVDEKHPQDEKPSLAPIWTSHGECWEPVRQLTWSYRSMKKSWLVSALQRGFKVSPSTNLQNRVGSTSKHWRLSSRVHLRTHSCIATKRNRQCLTYFLGMGAIWFIRCPLAQSWTNSCSSAKVTKPKQKNIPYEQIVHVRNPKTSSNTPTVIFSVASWRCFCNVTKQLSILAKDMNSSNHLEFVRSSWATAPTRKFHSVLAILLESKSTKEQNTRNNMNM